MASGLSSPAGDELERLRQQYDRLCDLMTRTAESDPVGAERVLNELQTLSERILALQTTPAVAPPPPIETAPPPAPEPRQTEGPTTAVPEAPSPSQPAAGPEPARIVHFRVTPSIGQRPASDTAPQTPASSWRLDAPPPELDRRDSADEPAPAAPATEPSPPLPAAAPAQGPGTPPVRQSSAATPRPVHRPSITVRRSVAAKPSTAAQPAPARPAPPAEPTAAAPTRAPAAPSPAPAAAAAAEAAGNATLFSSAIRQWLERHRGEAPQPAAATPPATGDTDAKASAAAPGKKHAATAPQEPEAISRVAAAIEQQALQIERILALCEAHQAALERLEARIAVRPDAPAPVPAKTEEFADLRAAVEEQRRRITALAKTIHNLAQWLATQRGS